MAEGPLFLLVFHQPRYGQANRPKEIAKREEEARAFMALVGNVHAGGSEKNLESRDYNVPMNIDTARGHT